MGGEFNRSALLPAFGTHPVYQPGAESTGVFKRGTKLWITYKDADGVWKNKRTGLSVGQEEEAQATYEEVVCMVAAKRSPEPSKSVRDWRKRRHRKLQR
jgi:hypothetical protein